MTNQIWSYWEGKRPGIVKKCIESWHRHAPGWTITVLNEHTATKFPIKKPSTYDSLSSTTKSDVIRLSLLAAYGGLWLDASVYLTEPLDWALNQPGPCVAFTHLQNPYLESWFIYVPFKDAPFIIKWLGALNSILEYNPHSSHHAYNKPCVYVKDYLMVYQAMCYLVQFDVDFRREFTKVHKKFQYLDVMYNIFIPLDKHDKLVKFTKGGRTKYDLYAYPKVYILALFLSTLICVVSIFVIAMVDNGKT